MHALCRSLGGTCSVNCKAATQFCLGPMPWKTSGTRTEPLNAHNALSSAQTSEDALSMHLVQLQRGLLRGQMWTDEMLLAELGQAASGSFERKNLKVDRHKRESRMQIHSIIDQRGATTSPITHDIIKTSSITRVVMEGSY